MKTVYAIILSLRPLQWTKNTVVLAGVIYSRNFFDLPQLLRSLGGALIFCSISGGCYLLNDVFDVSRDRSHPVKSKRPIAAGVLPVPQALTIAIILLVISNTAGFLLGRPFGLITTSYTVMVTAYTLFLKKIAGIDIILIAVGFVLRAVAGAVVIAVEISPWLMACTFTVALFLVVGKRYHDRIGFEEQSVILATIAVIYPKRYLELVFKAAAISTVIVYAVYTVAPRTQLEFGGWHLVYTLPVVAFGIARYYHLVVNKKMGGEPEKALLTDPLLGLTIAFWLVLSLWLVY